ncbi:MAG: NAD(+)/NADH kinase [Oscillospiraceae bacterium]
MKKIALCPNVSRDAGLTFTLRVKAMLEQAGHEAVISPVYGSVPGVEQMPLEEALSGADLLVTLGGDGTILHLAPLVMRYKVPIIGVNLGHKGFLTELDAASAGMLLEAAAGRYELVSRMMLDIRIRRDGEIIFSDTAINEALISGIVQNVRLTAMSDGERILTVSGDGIIVSSPTGSTAYSMSAGGPLVEPNAENIIVTPICPHMLAARSFVLTPDRVVTVVPQDLEMDKRCIVSADGRGMTELQNGDEVIVQKSEHRLCFAHLGTKSFYETAFEKLGERE